MERRERVAVLGGYDFLEARWQTFAEWLDSPPTPFAAWYRPAAAVSCVVLIALAIAALAMHETRPELQVWLIALGGLQAAPRLAMPEQVRPVVAGGGPRGARVPP